jgi:hypothetical protein
MFVSSRALKLLAFLSTFAGNAILTTLAADEDIQQANVRRLTIASDESIALQIQTAHANNNSGGVNIFGTNVETPRYKLHAEQAWGSGGDFYINVKEATPAITSATTTSTNGGPARSVNDHHMATLLVADTDSVEERNTVAVIAVDKRTGNVSGIVNKENGEKFNFFQENGNKVRFILYCCCGFVNHGCFVFDMHSHRMFSIHA